MKNGSNVIIYKYIYYSIQNVFIYKLGMWLCNKWTQFPSEKSHIYCLYQYIPQN
jgi:hypothetical protein